jgi:hypothetical protein
MQRGKAAAIIKGDAGGRFVTFLKRKRAVPYWLIPRFLILFARLF